MPAIVMDNVPPELYERLRRRAQEGRRSVPEEALDLLRRELGREAGDAPPRLPDLILSGEEGPPPWDLPRPAPAALVPARPGGLRLPDPLA